MQNIKIIGIIVVSAIIGGWVGRMFFPMGGGSAGGPPAAAGNPMSAPAVRVMAASLKDTAPLLEYIAKVEPVRSVRLSVQVPGVIDRVHFTEGETVQRGDLLFTIEPSEYQARVAQARANLSRSEASLDRAEKFLQMYRTADARSISRSDMDAAEAGVAENKALVMQAKADLQVAEINLDHTQMTSPITGKIGKALITEGNYVAPGAAVLAEIVQFDPMRVVFSMPDSEYLALMGDAGENQIDEAQVLLPDGRILDAVGSRDFDSNQMTEGTGSIQVYLSFPNSHALLVPNGYVKVRFRRSTGVEKIILPQSAILSDKDGTYVWKIGADNLALQQRVVLGAMVGVERIVESGLNPGDNIVVSGLQKVRPGVPVRIAQ